MASVGSARTATLARHVLLGGPPGRSGLQCEATAGAASPRSEEAGVASAQGGHAKETQDGMATLHRTYQTDLRNLVRDGKLPSITGFEMPRGNPLSAKALGRLMDKAAAEGALEVFERLPGPWRAATTREAKLELLARMQRAESDGTMQQLYADFQRQFGGSLGANIAVPAIVIHSDSVRGSSEPAENRIAERMRLVARAIVTNPEDAERISRLHVLKEPIFGGFFDSVISTTDNELWKTQRRHFSEVFLPLSSLAQIFPVSLARARTCADRLAGLISESPHVDMSDFLLHEAQAQLQLALLGMPEEFMDSTNAQVRKVFMEHPDAKRGDLSVAMKGVFDQVAKGDFALPSDGCPVRAPLSQAVRTGGFSRSTDFGNMLLILFAGHDTTGHTMTWLLFELARHPDLQRKVQAEVDAFFAKLNGKAPEYRDLAGLSLLDRCVTETLRLWPAVANGTFRELQAAETVRGEGGAEVELPRGTFVNIVNWSRHRDPEQWGPDADEFNPMRDFAAGELAQVACPMAGTNPQSKRFSPFAHNPRSCLGKNFAQMEMRVIIIYLLHRFDFALAPPYDGIGAGPVPAGTVAKGSFYGVNGGVNGGGTMGPLDMERGGAVSSGGKPLIAMKLAVSPRRR